MKIYNFKQRSPEWYEIRRGVLTGSKFKEVLTPGGLLKTKGKGDSKEINRDFMIELALQELPIDPHEKKAQEILDRKFDIQWGNDWEDAAREWFAENVMPISQVGFVKQSENGFLGCSPDGLIPDGGELGKWYAGSEFKCPKLKTHTLWARAGVLPDEHKHQVHGNMVVTGLDVWYFMSYFPGYKPFIVEAKRNTFTEMVGKSLAKFEREYAIEREKVFDAIVFKESEVAA